MPFCKKCGNQLDDDAEFCPNCGTPSVLSASDTGQNSALSSDHISPSVGTQKDDGGSYGIALDNLTNGYELENGRYRIEKRVGTGGFATVYKAIDTRQDKIRAVKVFTDLSDDDEYALDKLRKEADLMDSITDERIIRFYDLNLKSTPKYLVMECIDGGNLEGLIVRSGGKLTEKRALDIAIEIAKGMKLVHRKGIIHKDLTPRNVMLTKDGKVKIMDFGISEALQTSRSRLEGPIR